MEQLLLRGHRHYTRELSHTRCWEHAEMLAAIAAALELIRTPVPGSDEAVAAAAVAAAAAEAAVAAAGAGAGACGAAEGSSRARKRKAAADAALAAAKAARAEPLMPFGKFKGVKVKLLPASYVRWMCRTHDTEDFFGKRHTRQLLRDLVDARMVRETRDRTVVPLV